MNFIFATIHVRDLERSIRFYEDVIGLKLVSRFPAGPDTQIAFLADGPAQVELICTEGETIPPYGEHPSLGFAAEDLDKAMADMKEKGVEVVSGPFRPNPKTRFFYVRDPDGVYLEIIENK